MNQINKSYELNKCQYMHKRCMNLFFTTTYDNNFIKEVTDSSIIKL